MSHSYRGLISFVFGWVVIGGDGRRHGSGRVHTDRYTAVLFVVLLSHRWQSLLFLIGLGVLLIASFFAISVSIPALEQYSGPNQPQDSPISWLLSSFVHYLLNALVNALPRSTLGQLFSYIDGTGLFMFGVEFINRNLQYVAVGQRNGNVARTGIWY